jgi:hypothetical protein
MALKTPAALAAQPSRSVVERCCRVFLRRPRRHGWPASPAIKERLALLDSQQGNKKQADVVIDPLDTRLKQAASGASPGLTIQRSGPGLNTRDEDTHTVSSGHGMTIIANGGFIL